MKEPRELLIHEMEDMLDAEQQILKALPKLAGEAQDPKLKKAFEHHEEETKQQVENLNQAFEALGEKPQTTTCLGVKGLISEHDAFLKEKPSPEVLQMFDLGAAAKTEQYEICSYTDMISSARLLGEDDVARLLEENLKHEKEMASKIEELTSSIAESTVKELAAV